MTIKTFKNWRGSLNEYLQVGDIVDDEMYEYFLDVLPPACDRSYMVQIGEPHDHVNGKAVYSTLERTEEGWKYCGHCHRGETVEPV